MEGVAALACSEEAQRMEGGGRILWQAKDLIPNMELCSRVRLTRFLKQRLWCRGVSYLVQGYSYAKVVYKVK